MMQRAPPRRPLVCSGGPPPREPAPAPSHPQPQAVPQTDFAEPAAAPPRRRLASQQHHQHGSPPVGPRADVGKADPGVGGHPGLRCGQHQKLGAGLDAHPGVPVDRATGGRERDASIARRPQRQLDTTAVEIAMGPGGDGADPQLGGGERLSAERPGAEDGDERGPGRAATPMKRRSRPGCRGRANSSPSSTSRARGRRPGGPWSRRPRCRRPERESEWP
jgi:hypothetical protein